MGNYEHLLVPGNSIVVRNARIAMLDHKFMRLLVNVEGRVEQTEDLRFEVRLDVNLSNTEYVRD